LPRGRERRSRRDARPSARRRPIEIRHARILHRDDPLPPDRERQDPQARTGRMGEIGPHRALAGALDRRMKPHDPSHFCYFSIDNCPIRTIFYIRHTGEGRYPGFGWAPTFVGGERKGGYWLVA